ncbi:MAG: CBS domain-containing protein [Desulfobulbaceae bacterium]
MSTGEFCTREVVITEKDSSILEVAQLMRTFHVGDVVVVEHRGEQAVPLGIITDRDIVVELIAQEVNLGSVTVGDIMSYDLLSVREDEGIWEVLLQMCDRGVRRIPVVNEEGGLEGILALDDMIELLAEELTLLAKIARSGPDRERKKVE